MKTARTRWLARTALCVWVALPVLAAAAEQATPALRAGAAASNITPWLGEPIVGGWKPRPATHVHDELWARCLVLDDGTTRLATVVADNVGIPREVLDEAKRQLHEHTNLPPNHMMMASTHTHSATPCRVKRDGEGGAELGDYSRFVARRIAEYRTLEHRRDVSLDIRQRELELAVRKPTPEQLAKARDMLAHPERPDKLPHERTYARRMIGLHERPDTVAIILQAVRIGDVGIAGIPFETFVETGLELKDKSPLKPTFTISFANGSYGYLPTPEQHRLGGYETWLGTSRVETQASTKITTALLDMFAEMRR